MGTSAERRHLLGKAVRRNMNLIEIAICTIATVCAFIYVVLLLASEFRYSNTILAWILGPGVVGLICLGLIGAAVTKKRGLFINLAVCSCGALVAGLIFGERNYWLRLANGYTYRDLVSYVDIDPAKDQGRSYMDIGHSYFKEHSYVVRKMFSKFKNGDTYCVAPIVRGPLKPVKGSNVKTKNGYVVPPSGSYDWWAIGTNCCNGNSAQNFTCGQVDEPLARSGMRLLNENQRPFYLLAVQEWSATHGLPVKHPVFFTWVKDPLETETQSSRDAESELWTWTGYVLLTGFVVSFLIHMFLFRNKIY